MTRHGRYKGLFTKIEEHIFERKCRRFNTFSYLVKVRNDYIGTFRSIESARNIRDGYLKENPIIRVKRKMGTGSITQDYRTKCGNLTVRIGNNRIGTVKSYQEAEDLLDSILNNPSIITKSIFSSGHDGATKRERLIINRSPKPKPKSNIGILIKNVRIQANMTRSDLAHYTDLSRYGIYCIEEGKSIPRFSTIRTISKALMVDADVFLDSGLDRQTISNE
jgi:DNA-binding XRE family transcriptional regulator